jgi:hypothetical protein
VKAAISAWICSGESSPPSRLSSMRLGMCMADGSADAERGKEKNCVRRQRFHDSGGARTAQGLSDAESQNRATKTRPRATSNHRQGRSSPPTRPQQSVSTSATKKASDTNSNKAIQRTQRLSPTPMYPHKRRMTRPPKNESCLRLLRGYTASR